MQWSIGLAMSDAQIEPVGVGVRHYDEFLHACNLRDVLV